MSYIAHINEQTLRNNLRLAAWAERWRATFGKYPSSYNRRSAGTDPRLVAGALQVWHDSASPG